MNLSIATICNLTPLYRPASSMENRESPDSPRVGLPTAAGLSRPSSNRIIKLAHACGRCLSASTMGLLSSIVRPNVSNYFGSSEMSLGCGCWSSKGACSTSLVKGEANAPRAREDEGSKFTCPSPPRPPGPLCCQPSRQVHAAHTPRPLTRPRSSATRCPEL